MHPSLQDAYVVFTFSSDLSKQFVKVASMASLPCDNGSKRYSDISLELAVVLHAEWDSQSDF